MRRLLFFSCEHGKTIEVTFLWHKQACQIPFFAARFGQIWRIWKVSGGENKFWRGEKKLAFFWRFWEMSGRGKNYLARRGKTGDFQTFFHFLHAKIEKTGDFLAIFDKCVIEKFYGKNMQFLWFGLCNRKKKILYDFFCYHRNIEHRYLWQLAGDFWRLLQANSGDFSFPESGNAVMKSRDI